MGFKRNRDIKRLLRQLPSFLFMCCVLLLRKQIECPWIIIAPGLLFADGHLIVLQKCTTDNGKLRMYIMPVFELFCFPLPIGKQPPPREYLLSRLRPERTPAWNWWSKNIIVHLFGLLIGNLSRISPISGKSWFFKIRIMLMHYTRLRCLFVLYLNKSNGLS